MLAKHCFELTKNKDDAVATQAEQILCVLQADPVVTDLALLTRCAVDYSLLYFYALFVELVDALAMAHLSSEWKINSLLACAAIFSFYQKLLHTEEIFATRAQQYQTDVFEIVVIDSALICESDGVTAEKKQVFLPAFQYLFERLQPVVADLCRESPQVARLYGRAYVALDLDLEVGYRLPDHCC